MIAKQPKPNTGDAPAQPRRPRLARRKDVGAPPVHDYHYALLASAVYADVRLNDSARRVLAFVVQMARGRPVVDLWVEQIADVLGLSVRTVQRAQALAERHGYVAVEHRRQGRRNQSNRYSALAPCIPAARPAPSPDPNRELSGDNFVTPRGRQVTPSPLPPPSYRGEGDKRPAGRGASARRLQARGQAPPPLRPHPMRRQAARGEPQRLCHPRPTAPPRNSTLSSTSRSIPRRPNRPSRPVNPRNPKEPNGPEKHRRPRRRADAGEEKKQSTTNGRLRALPDEVLSGNTHRLR